MDITWFKHLKKEEQANFKLSVQSSKKVLDRMSEICYNSIKEVGEVSKSDYTNAAWAYEQAHRNGMMEAYRNIARLCDSVKEIN